jgi:purine-cytosine permease-like protein
MVAGLLRVLIKLAVAAAVVLLALTIVGDYFRHLVPEQFHRAVWQAGLLIFFPCAFGFALVAKAPPTRRRLENLLIVGAIIGALVFILFISNVDCTLTPGGRSGMRLNCRDLGEP